MLSRTADHLFWMSRYTERAALFASANREDANNCAKHLLCAHQKPAAGRLSTQHRVHAQRVRGSQPCSIKEAAC